MAADPKKLDLTQVLDSDPENAPAETPPSRSESISAAVHEPSNMSHVWGIVFALAVVAIVSIISFFRIGGLRDDVDSLKATKAERSTVDSMKIALGVVYNKTVALETKVVAHDDTFAKIFAAAAKTDSTVKKLGGSVASLNKKAKKNTEALEALTGTVTSVGNDVEILKSAPALFSPDQLARLKAFADTPATPPATNHNAK